MKRFVLLTALFASAVFPLSHAAEQPGSKSRVIAVHDTEPSNIDAMVAAGIKALAGPNDEAAAWHAFVSSNDVVGIKINTQPAPGHGTHRAVVDAIITGLRGAGVPAENIWVFDRDGEKMRALGYKGPRAMAVVGGTSWDAAAFYESKLVGRLIWGDLLFRPDGDQLSTRSHLPKLVTQTITKLINVPVLQSHDACGLCGCLYNISLGMVDNARRFEGDADAAIAEICAMPALRRKLVLNVMDALVGGYAGGPSFRPQYSWKPGMLYFSMEPVALDTVCLQLLETKRKAANVPTLCERAGHIPAAASLGLGRNNLQQIEVIEVTP